MLSNLFGLGGEESFCKYLKSIAAFLFRRKRTYERLESLKFLDRPSRSA